MVTTEELVDELLGTYDQPDVEVVDTKTAQDALRRLRRIEWQRAHDNRLAYKELARIQGFIDERDGVHDREAEYSRRSLETWHRAHVHQLPGKTYRTAHGESKLTAKAVRVEFENKADTLKWAIENNRVDLLDISINAVKVRKACSNQVDAVLSPDDIGVSVAAIDDNGERIPSVTLHREEPIHSIKISEVNLDV